jgi:hypothetical protein
MKCILYNVKKYIKQSNIQTNKFQLCMEMCNRNDSQA